MSEIIPNDIIRQTDNAIRETLNSQKSIPTTIQVIRRNGQVVNYDDSKIALAMEKAFIQAEKNKGNKVIDKITSSSIVNKVTGIRQTITKAFQQKFPGGGVVHIEEIQNIVESSLMDAKEHDVARAYVLYREERRKEREQAGTDNTRRTIHVKLDDGSRVPLDDKRLTTVIFEACEGLPQTDPNHILQETLRNLYDGVPHTEVNSASIMSARTMVEYDPEYSFVAARLLLDSLRSEALTFLGVASNATAKEMQSLYAKSFPVFIERGIELGILNPELNKRFDLKKLSAALHPERDNLFTYLSIQTLYDRYFIHSNKTRYELPQAFFMRVAMGLALEEDNPTERAIEFYQLISSHDYMCSTPTLFNAGTVYSQLSSCFLTTIPDDLHGIFGALQDNAMLSKFAGGLGNDWTNVRASSSLIKGTNGESNGVVPFMNVCNSIAVAVNQGGKRKGAVCGYLESWHLDIEAFLELRKNTGDERLRTHDMNTANWIPDLLMKRVMDKGDWTLFSPNDVPELHDLYGAEFEKAYETYEAKARAGEIKNHKVIPALQLWRKMLSMLFETGHPWVTFKDPCNLRSPQQHCGVIHSSNLCTEITLNTSQDEIAVCNLGSINLAAHVNESGLDTDKLQRTIKTAMRMLDNVIDINYYAVPQAKNSNLKHRPVGMGLMGFQDALYKLKIDYCSDAAIEFADQSMEHISYYAIDASSDLAKERGQYQSFEGSLWDQGILPIDSAKHVQQNRAPEHFEQNLDSTLNWDNIRQKIKTQGMRNSNVLAIAPTATISNICGVSQSIEPTYQNLFVKSNLSGEFTVVNPYLVRDLKELNLWDEVMVNDLKYFDGSVQQIDRIPADIKNRYAGAFEIDAKWLVECASRRQKWIDQAQSLNLYMAQPSGKKLDSLYKMAWTKGLKTTYYLRSLGISDTEKSTVQKSAMESMQSPTNSAPKACSILDPDCEACQ